jgi:NOL1/NOP2/fmu family ribosome biogenesis protein
MKREKEFRVERVIDEMLPRAIRPTKAGIRISLDIYLTEDDKAGSDWASVVFLDPETRKQINAPANSIPLDSLDAVKWWVGRMVEKAEPRTMRKQPRPPAGE